MDITIEITARNDDGSRVVVGPSDVFVFDAYDNAIPRASHIVPLDCARLIAKAIADYDRAVAAVGGGE